MDGGVHQCSSVFGLVVCALSILDSVSTSRKSLLVPKTVTTTTDMDRVARL